VRGVLYILTGLVNGRVTNFDDSVLLGLISFGNPTFGIRKEVTPVLLSVTDIDGGIGVIGLDGTLGEFLIEGDPLIFPARGLGCATGINVRLAL
ncbi:Hypothetical protein HVR_LOCUS1332, partial [uncultured virus]